MKNEDFDYTEIYKIYYERLKAEGDWIWSRFKIYMTLNTGAVAAIGLLFRDFRFDLSTGDFTRLIILLGVSIIGRQLALEWKNISIQSRFWESVLTWHVAEIERKIDKEAVDLYLYLDNCEKSEGYVAKDGMNHIVEQVKTKRKDPIFSNESVSDTFRRTFEVTFLLSLFAIVACFVLWIL